MPKQRRISRRPLDGTMSLQRELLAGPPPLHEELAGPKDKNLKNQRSQQLLLQPDCLLDLQAPAP